MEHLLTWEQLVPDARVRGLVPQKVAQIVRVDLVGDSAAKVTYRTEEGVLGEQTVFDGDLERLALAETHAPWTLAASGEDFKLGAEAYRIHLAHLFDPMMAVHTADVIPLPHQITAVYESMLPRQPLRFVLADDPGAGKTIMAGLLIRELILRSDAERVLIVAPGSLTAQWQDELLSKFGIEFPVLSKAQVGTTASGNPFVDTDRLIVRLDQLSRSDELKALADEAEWDLVIFDEAHKLSAQYFGNELKKTQRYQLAELLGARTRHLLLMTATPHNGKEEDFQAFLALLDSDRFYGKYREGTHEIDTSDLMRRMVKEELVKFDGTPLFPERRAYTVLYPLSNEEAVLYARVTTYVREQMDAAERLDGRKRGAVGFALTILQRRLASSPEAIYKSLERRRIKIEAALREALQGGSDEFVGGAAQYPHVDADFDESDYEGEEIEALEDELAGSATTARTIDELRKEVAALRELEQKAHAVWQSGEDRKWQELSKLLQDQPQMYRADGTRRKLLIFTEHRDTLEYLASRIRGLLGVPDAVQVIHGSTPRDKRREVQERFRSDPDVLVLVATDAAGEGVNLQTANLMVNYDLPWNPNRLEQRFGRIHRIGQTEVCHLWNLVAQETREGDVFQRLFEKLEVEREALKGRVFDVLGELFDGKSLQDLLLEAIRYGDDPNVRKKLFEKVETKMDHARILGVLDKHALAHDVMPPERLFEIKAQMDRAEARRLQPRYVQAFVEQAFRRLGGELLPREEGRYEIRHVPATLRSERPLHTRTPVLRKYERVCFDKAYVHVPGKVPAAILHPAHPFVEALIAHTLGDLRSALQEGTVLVNEQDCETTLRVLFLVDHAIYEGAEPSREASRRLHLVELGQDGSMRSGGAAAYLDYRPLRAGEEVLVAGLLEAPWLAGSKLEALAMNYATERLAREHTQEEKARRAAWVDKTIRAVHARLTKEIYHQQNLVSKLKKAVAEGKQPQVQLINRQRLVDELTSRLAARTRELEAQRHLSPGVPAVAGVALVVPQGWLDAQRGEVESPASAEARRRVELAAMNAVMEAERALGFEVTDVSADNKGWDVEARMADGSLRLIEVKGRHADAVTVTVTHNEIMHALNKPDQFFLAIVRVKGSEVDGPHYVREPFSKEPDVGASSVTYSLAPLLSRSMSAAATLVASKPKVVESL